MRLLAVQALKLFSAAVIVPTMQIAWTLLSITCGMVYYQEYLGFNTLKACMFALGVLVSGLVQLYSRQDNGVP